MYKIRNDKNFVIVEFFEIWSRSVNTATSLIRNELENMWRFFGV